jgi:hypothetical protein
MKNILTKIRRNSIPNSRISEVLGLSSEVLKAFRATKFKVTCMDEGERVVVTRKRWSNEELAHRYADTVSPSREALVEVDSHTLTEGMYRWIDFQLTKQFALYNRQRRETNRTDANYAVV